MALTYSSLAGTKADPDSIAWWVNATNLPAASLITDAQAYIYGHLRTREMKATAPISVVLNDATHALPTRFLDPWLLQDRYGMRVELIPPRNLMNRWVFDDSGLLQQGRISYYAIMNEQVVFDTKSDMTQTMQMLFYQRPADLAASTNETNWLTNRYPNMIRAACLFHAFEFRQDMAMVQYWQQRTDKLIADANAEADLSQFGGDFPVEVR
jgi:hypothetical protein